MKARVTIDWLEPLPDGTPVPMAVFEFDQVILEQRREIDREVGDDGKTTRFIPGEITTKIVGKSTR